jgi:aspartyl/asparaginyl-tRNA synthetase
MMRSYFSVVFFLCLGVLAGSCDQFNKLTATKIKDILERPRDYENKEVTVHGTVTESASILIAKYFVLQDNTGSIKVVTNRVLPKKGEQLSVTGYMESIEIGPERWIVLREKSTKPSSEKD